MAGRLTLLRGIRRLVTLDHGHDGPAVGEAMGDLKIIEGAAIAAEDGRIVEVGPDRTLARRYREAAVRQARGTLVTPAIVDPHTHPVFAAPRVGEWKQRLAGASYQEIAAAGGGIMSSVRSVRDASDRALRERLATHAARLHRHGIAFAEAKSGYGLSLDDEIRMLMTIRWWNRSRADEAGIRFLPTCLAAHSVPREYRNRRRRYIDLVCGKILPEVKRRDLAERADIFCETGVFDLDETREILERARELGFRLTIHADQLSRLGGGKLAAELGADSADHLEYADAATIRAMRDAGTACVLIPGSTFYLKMNKWAPGRKMVDAGAVVALATDFNPGSSPIVSPAACMTLAAMHNGLTPEECLTGFTLNAAWAIKVHDDYGSLRPGRRAVVTEWDVEEPAEIAYAFGDNRVVGVTAL